LLLLLCFSEHDIHIALIGQTENISESLQQFELGGINVSKSGDSDCTFAYRKEIVMQE
jgi:hypothetical protein